MAHTVSRTSLIENKRGWTRFQISKISDNLEIQLHVLRCSKNNIYSETCLVLIKFLAQEVYDIYRYNTILQISTKKSDILV
jgi:hypothetical protein